MGRAKTSFSRAGVDLDPDGLAPEGGEPQLWLVRELRTGQTLRSGWLSEQGQTAFENFLRPIAEQGLGVEAVLSDKQRGLVPAVGVVFPQAKHAFCQSHYLGNIAEPVTQADEALKVSLRQQVRAHIGELIRPEQVEQAGVLTVTGLLPSPIKAEPAVEPVACVEAEPARPQPEQAELETAFKRRVRYELTLKGRPPLRLAGIEMYARLTEVSTCLGEMMAHTSSACLEQLQQGLDQALTMFKADYLNLSQGADWLHQISNLLDPHDKPTRTGEQVRQALLTYLDEVQQQSQANDVLTEFARQIAKTTHNYQPGLFHTYDLPDLPRTNNDRESEFRQLNQQVLRTTGQKGATRRLIQHSGAWELIPRPGSLPETIQVISAVEPNEYEKERTRVRSHRNRFLLHTRSVKHSRKQLQDLKERWLQLPPDKVPGWLLLY
ncbi:MAG: transposase, partial [Chloroflexota bacterium]